VIHVKKKKKKKVYLGVNAEDGLFLGDDEDLALGEDGAVERDQEVVRLVVDHGVGVEEALGVERGRNLLEGHADTR
jgi:hypothetical protein